MVLRLAAAASPTPTPTAMTSSPPRRLAPLKRAALHVVDALSILRTP